jgi:peptide/nickel transport system ATP-binding protein
LITAASGSRAAGEPAKVGEAAERGGSPLLAIEGLRTWLHVPARGRFVQAAARVDLTLHEGETLCIVGESGSGKSVTMLSVLGLLTAEPGIVGGRIWYRRPGTRDPQNLLAGIERFVKIEDGPPLRVAKDVRGFRRHHERTLRPLRGRDFAMIFQSPRTALHPHLTVGQQLGEAIRRARPETSHGDAQEEAVELLSRVHLDAPRARLADYPHRLSGGMCQRVMIALALAARPALLIADEPTTGLDATVQSRVLDLMEEVKHTYRTATIVVTHDIGVARRLADRIAVMYAGRVVEVGPADALLDRARAPKHPYTDGLLRAIPTEDDIRERRWLQAIGGDVPDLAMLPPGCPFAARCGARPEADPDRCDREPPPRIDVAPDHALRCWRHAGAKLDESDSA